VKTQRYRVNVYSPFIRGSLLTGIAGSAAISRPSTPDCYVKEDLKMEHLEGVLRGINSK